MLTIRRRAHHARRAGVDVQFDVYPGMVHVFQFMYLIEPKSRQAVRVRFVRKHWGEENAGKSAANSQRSRRTKGGESFTLPIRKMIEVGSSPPSSPGPILRGRSPRGSGTSR